MAATSNRTIAGFLEHIWSPEAPHCVAGSTTESLDYGMVHNRALLSCREEQAQPKKILGYQQTPNFPLSYWRSNCRIGCIGKPVQGNAQKAIWDLMLFLLLPDCARMVKFLKKSIRCRINETPSYAFSRVKTHSFVKLIVTISIGVAIGVLSVGLASVTENLRRWKNFTSRCIIHDGHPHGILRAGCFHMGYSTILILLGSSLVSAPTWHTLS